MIYNISTVRCNSSWQLPKPDITQLPILWLLGAVFKDEAIAPGGNNRRCTSKTHARHSATSAGGRRKGAPRFGDGGEALCFLWVSSSGSFTLNFFVLHSFVLSITSLSGSCRQRIFPEQTQCSCPLLVCPVLCPPQELGGLHWIHSSTSTSFSCCSFFLCVQGRNSCFASP